MAAAKSSRVVGWGLWRASARAGTSAPGSTPSEPLHDGRQLIDLADLQPFWDVRAVVDFISDLDAEGHQVAALEALVARAVAELG